MEWFYKYFSLTAVIAGSWFLIRYLIQKKIDSYFNTKLENHKKDLEIVSKNVEYDISKKLFDFEAYASKKHTVYPEIYSLIFQSWSDLSSFRFKFDLEIRDSKNDLDEATLRPLFYEKMKTASTKHREASNYFYKNELYLSREISVAYEEILQDQKIFELLMVNSFDENIHSDNWKDASSRLIVISDEYSERINIKLSKLKEIIYKELSYTHYEK